MTTTNPGTAVAAQSNARLPAQQQTSLPDVLTKQSRIPGYRNPQWQTRALGEAERSEIEQWLACFEAALRPAEITKIMHQLMELAQVYGLKGEEADVQVRLRTMASDLQEFSDQHIAAAIRHHRRESDFFPTIAQMRTLCVNKQATAAVYRHRARVLLGLNAPAHYEIPAPQEAEGSVMLSRRHEVDQALRGTFRVPAKRRDGRA